MAEISRKIDVEKLMSYSDDLVQLLKNEKDINDLKHCVEISDALRSRCRSDYAAVQSSLEAITNEIKDLEEQRSLIEERGQVFKKLKQDELKAQMKISMFASVTKIIPDLNDQSKMISGSILLRKQQHSTCHHEYLSRYTHYSSIPPLYQSKPPTQLNLTNNFPVVLHESKECVLRSVIRKSDREIEMEGGVIDERIGNKRGRDEKGSIGRLEKRPSGMVVLEEYSGDEMINGVKYEEEKPTPGGDGGGGGGLFSQLIVNLVNSPKSSQQPEEKNGDEGGGEDGGALSNGGEVVAEKEDGGGEVEENEEDGGDDIVAQLPATLSDVFKIEDTAPATDEASILLHSIIHD
ncbi:hypothetical protein L2E82_01469 [Cichorium intybus]|uniref:Uncharacterized protein n=1 Tax=Cichorium intybus TaxID=13427 RepID=A0ACB9H079_CICIN|nr:hypothetical protein L2E82_01469 [Cichorium intybus]